MGTRSSAVFPRTVAPSQIMNVTFIIHLVELLLLELLTDVAKTWESG